MARHSFKLSTVSRAIRAARNAGAPVDRVEIGTDGNVILHMVKSAETGAVANERSAPAVRQRSAERTHTKPTVR